MKFKPYKVVGGTCALGVCDRCHMTKYLGSLVPDGEYPSLRVCPTCADIKDPWTLPPRKTESITLRYPRPDGHPSNPDGDYPVLDGHILATESGAFITFPTDTYIQTQ